MSAGTALLSVLYCLLIIYMNIVSSGTTSTKNSWRVYKGGFIPAIHHEDLVDIFSIIRIFGQ